MRGGGESVSLAHIFFTLTIKCGHGRCLLAFTMADVTMGGLAR